MNISRREEISLRGDQRETGRRENGCDRFALKLLMGAAEMIDNLLVFLRFCRTGTIDQQSAGSQETARRLKQPSLCLLMLLQLIGLLVPFPFRMSSDDSQPAARRIDQNAIEWPVKAFAA